MLSKYFENTKPITFIIVLIALLIGDGLYQFQILQQPLKVGTHLIFLSISLTLLLFSLVLLHQIDRWNELTETKNSYSIAFFSILVVLFPALFDNMKLVGANLLIICASLLHPWALVFLLNVWISLLFYGAEKRRYWFIPLLAILVIALLGGAIFLVLQMPFPFDSYYILINKDITNLLHLPSYPIATTVALVSLGLLFLVSIVVYYFRSTYHSISSIVVVQFLWVGLLVAFLSKEVIYIFAPIAILFALYIEKIRVWWLKETVLWILLSLPATVLLLHFITKS